ncbi:MAG: chemotaxis protein CheW, partial [bacterium]|nr:chemotaxis protein CheW [bacterium]
MEKNDRENPIKKAFFSNDTEKPREEKKSKKKVREKKTDTLKETKLNLQIPEENRKSIRDEFKLIVFRLGENYFGLEISDVTEIIRIVEISKVPDSPKYLDGIINYRGEIVPVINLKYIFEFDETSYNSNNEIIIVKSGGQDFGLIVDNVTDFLSVTGDQVLFTGEKAAPYIKFSFGILDSSEEVVFLLNVEQLLNSSKLEKINKLSKGSLGGYYPVPSEGQDAEAIHSRTIELRKKKIEETGERQQVITFTLGNERYGLQINHIR